MLFYALSKAVVDPVIEQQKTETAKLQSGFISYHQPFRWRAYSPMEYVRVCCSRLTVLARPCQSCSKVFAWYRSPEQAWAGEGCAARTDRASARENRAGNYCTTYTRDTAVTNCLGYIKRWRRHGRYKRQAGDESSGEQHVWEETARNGRGEVCR